MQVLDEGGEKVEGKSIAKVVAFIATGSRCQYTLPYICLFNIYMYLVSLTRAHSIIFSIDVLLISTTFEHNRQS